MVDAFTDLSVPSFFVSGDLDVDGTTNLDAVDVDGAVNFAADVTFCRRCRHHHRIRRHIQRPSRCHAGSIPLAATTTWLWAMKQVRL